MRGNSRKYQIKSWYDNILTWANQTRILAQSFEQLGSVIGGALINAFKPLVAWLNRAMLSIISFAQTVVNALGKIFGWTYEIKGGGIANDFEMAGDGAEDMADGTGAAKDNLEKMQKYIAAWHEVNNMTTKDDDAGGGKGGGGGGGLGDLGDATSGQLVRTEGLFEKYKSDIDSLYELGEYIGKVLTDAMNSIDWDKVYEKARNFGKGLADFLNGLISPELFGAVGRTIAGALNTAIYAALSFGERFDWKDFGLSIATGINEFFKTFDFASLAKTVNVWAKGILDTIITVLDKTNWKLMGEKIGTFLAGIDLMEIMGKVAKAIWKALNAAFDTYSRMFEIAPFETALLSLVGVTKLLKVAKFQALINVFSKGFTVIGTFFNALSQGSGVLGSLMITFPKVGAAVKVLNDSLLYLKMGFADGQFLNGLNYAFKNISENLTVVQKGFIGITAAFAEFAIFKNITRDMETGTENIVTGLLKLAATAGIAGTALSAVFGFPAGVIAMGVIALTGALFGLNEAQNEIVENSSIGQFSNSIDELSENIASKTETIKNNISSMKENLESSGAAQSQMARDLANEYVELSEKTGLTVNEQIRLKEISEQLVGIVPGLSDYINDQTGVLEIQKDTLNDLVENMDLYAKKQAAQEMLVEAYKAQYEAAVNVQKAEEGMAEAAEDFINTNDGMADSVKNMVKEGDIEGLKELRQELWEGTSEFGSLKEAFGEGAKNIGMVDKMIESLEQSMGGYTEALSDANGVLNDSNKMIDFANEAYMESAKAISENETRMVENTKATTEYQQKLRDITSELSKFGTSFSEEFKEKLALDDTNMVNSVVEAFSKMDQQVQLSAGELQQLFANIAPGMSNHFINALAGQEPAIQAQVSATMANISSGAQVSSDEVKGVFSAIGYDLPQETINSFLSQESPLQSSVIGLLSSVANGSSLVSENLYALFRGLGIGLPNELIETLGGPNVSAETQQAAINLLSQLAAGCDMSAEEIQNRFVEFGLQIPEVLQTAIDSGTTQTYLKAQGLLNELSSAASEEERQRIVAEYNALGQGVLDEGIIAALEDENREVRSAALGVINEISSATTGEEREAAIAAANSFATDYIGEISGTMTSLADSKMPEVGKHIFGGVASGMMEDNGEMATAAESVMSRAEGDLRKAGRIHSPSERMMPIGSYLLQGIVEGFTSSIGQWTASITTWATETYNLFSSNITKTIADATTWFSELPGKIYTAIFPTNERVTTWGGEVFQTFQTNVDNSIAGVVDWFSELPEKIYGTIINFVTQTLPQWEGNINDFFGNAIPNIIGNVVDLFGDLRESLVPVGENLIKGLWDGIQSLTDWLGTKIGGFCRGVISTFKEGFDEHSPSKEAFKIGEYFTIGLQNGLSERFTDVYGDVESLAKNINSIRISPLIFDDSLPTIEDYTPKFGDMGAIQSKIQMEIDAKMAQMAYEERRTQEMLEQIIEAIDRKQLVVGDKDIFEANKRETLRFGRRTKKDPYPIYGKF